MAGPSFKRTLRLARTIVLPVGGGLAVFAAYGAPPHYAAVNAAAFVLGLIALHFLRLPSDAIARRVIALALLATLALPLVTGPELDGARRWFALGPLTLNSGMLLSPVLAMLAMRDRAWGWAYPTVGIILAALQVDAALALAFAATLVMWSYIMREWRGLPPTLLGLAACVFALRSGGPAPVPFVEGMIPMLWESSPPAAIGVAALLLSVPILILKADDLAWPDRLVLAAVFAAFTAISLVGDYPVPLAGYGASAILGFMLALAATVRRATDTGLPKA